MLGFTGPPNENVKVPKAESSVEQQATAVTSDTVLRPPSVQQPLHVEEKTLSGTNKEVASLSAKESPETGRKPSISQSIPGPGIELYFFYVPIFTTPLGHIRPLLTFGSVFRIWLRFVSCIWPTNYWKNIALYFFPVFSLILEKIPCIQVFIFLSSAVASSVKPWLY